MSTIGNVGSVLGLIVILALSSCATRNAASPVAAGPAKFPSGIGVVQSIALVSPETAIGRIAENQSAQKPSTYKFLVHMDDDSDQTIMQKTNDGFAVGDCVQFQNKDLHRCGHKLGE